MENTNVEIKREQLKDRTITLSHAEFAMIIDALSSASVTLMNYVKDMAQNPITKQYHPLLFDKANKFYDLGTDLSNRKNDVL